MRGRWRYPGAVPHVAEFIIGRAFARPVGSCGLQAAADDADLPALDEVEVGVAIAKSPHGSLLCHISCWRCFAAAATND
jgi:hypothetical protein